MAKEIRDRLEVPYWMLRGGLGATAFLAGADKFFNKMTVWEKYLSPVAERNLPVSGSTFMKAIGVVEMVVGASILNPRTTRVGAYAAAGWLCCIAANLVTGQDYWDIAARDVNMAIGAFALGELDAIRNAESTRSRKAHRYDSPQASMRDIA